MDPNERYSRQKDLVPAERLAGCQITVVGVGAIGRQVVLQLAAMGAMSLQLVDFDRVEESNLASQGYWEEDMGQLKVQATGILARKINPQIQVQELDQRFGRSMDVGNVLFSCVDSIVTRKLIWESVRNRVGFFCDTRMSAEVVRILAACDASSREHYPTTLFEPQEAHAGSCTAKSTIYTAGIAAGLALGQFTRHLRNLPVDPDLTFNILTSELALAVEVR